MKVTRLVGQWMCGLHISSNLSPLLKKKLTQSTSLPGAQFYPFHIKDQWVELKNTSLLENKKSLNTKWVTVLPGYSFYLKRCNKKNKEIALELFSISKETGYNLHTCASPRVTWGKPKGSPFLLEPAEDTHGPQDSKVPPQSLSDVLKCTRIQYWIFIRNWTENQNYLS